MCMVNSPQAPDTKEKRALQSWQEALFVCDSSVREAIHIQIDAIFLPNTFGYALLNEK